MRRLQRQLAIALASVLLPICGGAAAFKDPLDVPAAITARATSNLMLDVAWAGDRLVAVGELGRIVISDDTGRSWRQVASPVSVGLVAVDFPTPRLGWAVGHGGVILHSNDGGQSWSRQLDGRQAEQIIREHYQKRIDAGEIHLEPFLRDVDLNFAHGPELPLLDVWFRNELEGFAVGGFGMILATKDGGRSWLPWMDRIENPEVLHLNAIEGIGGVVFIAGERGRVWTLDAEDERFVEHQTGYNGSFFGLVGASDVVMALGLRGNAFRSTDGGASWQALVVPTQAAINAGAVLEDGRVVLVTQAGELILGHLTGSEFVAKPASVRSLLAGLAPAGPDAVIIAGLRGLSREKLPESPRLAGIETGKGQ